MSDEKLLDMAQHLAQDCIVTRALSRYLYQIVEAIHEDTIAPLRAENERLKAEIKMLRKGT